MRQLDATRAALAQSAATAETVLLVTMPTAGSGHYDGLAAIIGTYFGHGAWVPISTIGTLTLVAQTVEDLDDMRSFMDHVRGVSMNRLWSVTATLFSQGTVADHVAGHAAPWPLGIEPEIARWRDTVVKAV